MPTSRRTRAREVAMQMLYQADLNPDAKADTIRSMIAEEMREPGLQEFADRKSTRLNSSHVSESRMPSSA